MKRQILASLEVIDVTMAFFSVEITTKQVNIFSMKNSVWECGFLIYYFVSDR